MSGTELSRVRTEFRLRLPQTINKIPLESSGAGVVMQSWELSFPAPAEIATKSLSIFCLSAELSVRDVLIS
jgi:hypothetical protein